MANLTPAPIDQAHLQMLSDAMLEAMLLVHEQNARWWRDLRTGQPLSRNVGEMLMLIVSELAEGMEGHRKSLPDDKLPQYPMLTVELADAVIRIFDMAAGLNLNLASAFRDKMLYNATRKDHTAEARLAAGGKAY